MSRSVKREISALSCIEENFRWNLPPLIRSAVDAGFCCCRRKWVTYAWYRTGMSLNLGHQSERQHRFRGILAAWIWLLFLVVPCDCEFYFRGALTVLDNALDDFRHVPNSQQLGKSGTVAFDCKGLRRTGTWRREGKSDLYRFIISVSHATIHMLFTYLFTYLFKYLFTCCSHIYSHSIHISIHMLFTCSSHALHMLFTCYSHAIHMLFTCYSHAIHMLFTFYSHAIHMLFTYLFTCYSHIYSHAIHMLFTCYSHIYSHAIHMLFTCYSHAIYMLFTCSSHAIHMLFTCYSHAIYMLFTCYSHAIHILFTCYSHAIHISIHMLFTYLFTMFVSKAANICRGRRLICWWWRERPDWLLSSSLATCDDFRWWGVKFSIFFPKVSPKFPQSFPKVSPKFPQSFPKVSSASKPFSAMKSEVGRFGCGFWYGFFGPSLGHRTRKKAELSVLTEKLMGWKGHWRESCILERACRFQWTSNDFNQKREKRSKKQRFLRDGESVYFVHSATRFSWAVSKVRRFLHPPGRSFDDCAPNCGEICCFWQLSVSYRVGSVWKNSV